MSATGGEKRRALGAACVWAELAADGWRGWRGVQGHMGATLSLGRLCRATLSLVAKLLEEVCGERLESRVFSFGLGGI